MKAAKQGGTPDHPEGEASSTFDTEIFYRTTGPFMGREMSVLEMKAIQQAWSIKRVERIFKQAWSESQRPAPTTTTVAP